MKGKKQNLRGRGGLTCRQGRLSTTWVILTFSGFMGGFMGGIFLSAGSVSAQSEILVAVGEDWDYFKGTREPSPDDMTGEPTTAWTELDFELSPDWLVGPTGIGYGDGDDATVLDDMRNSYFSVYARRLFEVSDQQARNIDDLVLRINYDDGFVAYLNGFEVARSGMTNPLRFNTAAASHEANGVEAFTIDAGLLESGENILAIQAHNTTLGSSDFSLIPELVSNPDLCPVETTFTCVYDFAAQSMVLNWVNATVYDNIEIWRGEELLDGMIFGDITTYTDITPIFGEDATYSIIAKYGNTTCNPIECTGFAIDPDSIIFGEGDDWRFFRGTQDPPFDWNALTFDDGDWEIGPSGIGYGDGDDQTLLDDMQEIAGVQAGYPAVFCRKIFEVGDPATQEFSLNIKYDDGIAVFVNGQEIGRVNLPLGDVSSATQALGATPEPSFFESIIDPSVLVAGENVIAVSVHNTSLTSSDLSFIPILYATGKVVIGENFQRGNINDDGQVNLTDAISLLSHLFQGQPAPTCADAADVDDNGALNLTDAIALLTHLFQGAEAPPAPGLSCGVDPTDDPLGNCSSSACGA